MRSITMIGAFPPPVHGMSAVNELVKQRFQTAFGDVRVFDIASPVIGRSLVARARRIPRVASAIIGFLCRGPRVGGVLYMSVSSGLGQLYELAFLLVAKHRGMAIVLHHHSYAYLYRRKFMTKWLVDTAGDEALHVTLSEGMSEKLKRMYETRKAVPVSNAVFMTSGTGGIKPRCKLKTIGFLSNISIAKGIMVFLELCREAAHRRMEITGLVAGPFEDKQTQDRVIREINSLSNVWYIGPTYGEAKNKFLEDIDVLLFPTTYTNEAEPVTIHEAMSHAVPVIAYGRGSIAEMISADCGLVVDSDSDFVAAALEQMKVWKQDESLFTRNSTRANERFSELRARSERNWEYVLNEVGKVSSC